jgi:hypothetical protein
VYSTHAQSGEAEQRGEARYNNNNKGLFVTRCLFSRLRLETKANPRVEHAEAHTNLTISKEGVGSTDALLRCGVKCGRWKAMEIRTE